MTDRRFGEIRSLVHGAIHETSWIALCMALDEWSNEELNGQILPYVQSHISKWSDAMRLAPKKWIAALRHGRHMDGMVLIKHIKMTHHQAQTSSIKHLGHSPALEQLTRLSIVSNLSDRDVHAFEAWPQLKQLLTFTFAEHEISSQGIETVLTILDNAHQLEYIDLKNNQINGDGLRHILTKMDQWPFMQTIKLAGNYPDTAFAQALGLWQAPETLRHFEFGGRSTPYGSWEGSLPHGLEAMLTAKWISQLHTLELPCNGINDDMHTLFSGPNLWKNLKNLNIAQNSVGPAFIEANLHNLSTLHVFNLGFNQPGAQGIHALHGVQWPMLKRLSLHANNLNADGLEALLSTASFPALQHLSMDLNRLDGEAMHLWDEYNTINALRYLDLSANALSDDGIYYLARATSMSTLQSLILHHNKIGQRGCRALATSHTLDNLTTLDLAHCPIGDQGAQALASGQGLNNLKVLNLQRCGIQDQGAYHLANSPKLGQLHALNLQGNPLTTMGLEHLANSPYLPVHLKMWARRAL